MCELKQGGYTACRRRVMACPPQAELVANDQKLNALGGDLRGFGGGATAATRNGGTGLLAPFISW